MGNKQQYDDIALQFITEEECLTELETDNYGIGQMNAIRRRLSFIQSVNEDVVKEDYKIDNLLTNKVNSFEVNSTGDLSEIKE